MIKTYEAIRNGYIIDGENERYATLYNSKQEVIDDMDADIFADKFNESVDNLNYPIITFDNAGSVDGILFGADASKAEILDEASNYFEAR